MTILRPDWQVQSPQNPQRNPRDVNRDDKGQDRLNPDQKQKVWNEVFKNCMSRKELERQKLIKSLDEQTGGNIAAGWIIGGVIGAIGGAMGGGYCRSDRFSSRSGSSVLSRRELSSYRRFILANEPHTKLLDRTLCDRRHGESKKFGDRKFCRKQNAYAFTGCRDCLKVLTIAGKMTIQKRTNLRPL